MNRLTLYLRRRLSAASSLLVPVATVAAQAREATPTHKTALLVENAILPTLAKGQEKPFSGYIAVGKFADFLFVDPRSPDTGPIHDAEATYVYACSLRNLKQVYVAGKCVADGERMTTFDESKVRQEVDTRIARITAESNVRTAAAEGSRSFAPRDAGSTHALFATIHPYAVPVSP